MTPFENKLRYIRDVHQTTDSSEPNRFDTYRPEYEAVLEELRSLAGGDTTEELVTWIAAQTVEQKRLPTPASVRRRAVELCLSQDLPVPEDSPLREYPENESATAQENAETTQPTSVSPFDPTLTEAEVTPEALEERLKVLEPYTTDELCAETGIETGRLRSLLARLTRKGTITKKDPPSSPTIWVRHPPKNACKNCGREFEVVFVHPVLSTVQYCTQCGTRL